jgi:carbamoyl-phosphate synthase small subunit
VVTIYGIDTRALVQHIRSKGAMNCIISTTLSKEKELGDELKKIPSMAGLELSSYISTKEPYTLGDKNAPLRVAVLDFGAKRNILQCMTERNIHVKVFPAKTDLKTLDEFKPHGYFASNGPGDPAAMEYAVKTIKDILHTGKPFFGICLGHQLLALANGIPTYKMHHGHRGMNHPVKNLMTGVCEITTQNHGFGVDAEAIKNNEHVEVTHLNLNDGSIEGIRLKDKPAFSVQYHPEAAPGPHDSRYLFDDFVKMMEKNFSLS